MSTSVVMATPGTVATVAPDALNELVARWLTSFTSTNTRNAYRRDVECFTRWCTDQGASPLHATRPAVDLYRAELESRELKPATVARRLSALHSFFEYGLDAGVFERNPVTRVRRPRVGTESPRLGLDRDEARGLLGAAEAAGARDHALVALLLLNGLRVSEAVGLDVADLDTERGHRVVRVLGKGGKVRTAPLAPRTAAALDAMLDGRTTGPVFTDATGGRLNRHQAARIVTRCARAAGITKQLSPHSLRHTFVTLSLDAGVPLHVVQDGAGHASPETTRRYDRGRHSLDGHATHTLSVHLADVA